jgi:hypothetical protein
MDNKASNGKQSFSLEITPARRVPQPELRAKVNEAIREASVEFQRQHKLSVQISGTADGGLFDLGASWPWVIHFGGSVLGRLLYKAGEEAAKEAGKEVGKEAGKSFFELLKESLRVRNLTVSDPYDLRLFPDPNNPYASLPPPIPQEGRPAKKQTRKKKSAGKTPKGKKNNGGKRSTTKRKRR